MSVKIFGILTLLIIGSAGYWSIEPLSILLAPQPFNIDVTPGDINVSVLQNRLTQQSPDEIISVPAKILSDKAPEPGENYPEESEVVRVVYSADQSMNDIVEDEWDEAAYLQHKQQEYNNLSGSERAAKKYIAALQNEMQTTMYDLPENDAVSQQLDVLFTPDDETQNHPIVDLQCVRKFCRVALNLQDEVAQYEAMDAITANVVGIQQTVADVIINEDDSRLVTLYLITAPLDEDNPDRVAL